MEKSPNCCTKPINDLSSVMLVGAGKSAIAATLPESISLPAEDRLKPQKKTSFCAQQNFFWLIVMPC